MSEWVNNENSSVVLEVTWKGVITHTDRKRQKMCFTRRLLALLLRDTRAKEKRLHVLGVVAAHKIVKKQFPPSFYYYISLQVVKVLEFSPMTEAEYHHADTYITFQRKKMCSLPIAALSIVPLFKNPAISYAICIIHFKGKRLLRHGISRTLGDFTTH